MAEAIVVVVVVIVLVTVVVRLLFSHPSCLLSLK